MRSLALVRARWGIGVALLLGLVAMVRYPGGDPLDRSSAGYAPTRNFLSDLGMTVAYNGQSNRLGASLFTASLLLLVASMGILLTGLLNHYSNTARARGFARYAGMVGAAACAAFVVVAFTPENRVLSLHVQATLLAWRLVPVASTLLTLAALNAHGVSRRSIGVLFALTVVLVAYVTLLGWGPSMASLSGLRINVVAQKVMAVVLAGALMLLSAAREIRAPMAASHVSSITAVGRR